MSDGAHISIENTGEQLICQRCNIPLVSKRANLTYYDNLFPVDLPACPECGLVYLPEDLALGRILYVEQALEDK